jgi:O-succinylbenzoate synthase
MAVTILMLAAGSAVAGPAKPTVEQAKKAAQAWLEDIAAAAPLTAVPFYSAAIGDGDDTCRTETTKTAADLPKRLTCLAKAVTSDDLVAWSKKAAKQLPAPLKAQKAKIAQLEKTSTIVHNHSECAGQGSDLIVAVALEPGDKPVAKVVAVLYQSIFCGE